MAHIEVERRSIDIEKWAKLVFDQIEKRIFSQSIPIDGWQVRSGKYHPEGYAWDNDFHSIEEGDVWGGPDVTCMFQSEFTIPQELNGKDVCLFQYTSAEVMISDNGRYLDGLDPNRSWCCFLKNAKPGEKHHLILEAYTRSKPDDDRGAARSLKGCLQHFSRPRMVVIDSEMLALKYDLDMLYQSATAAYMEEGAKSFYHHHMVQILKLFPPFETENSEAFKNAAPYIRKYIQDEVFQNSLRFGKSGKLACVAHSHLDLAYHWTMEQTVQKNARTVLIQLRLMDRYPEFHYSHTQAWTYEMLKKYYPDLFQQVKKRIAEGRWEVVGAMYVEPDCNLISAESFVRQIVYGKEFFQNEFGIDVDIAWLPDVFGNSPIMPQILKQGGINYFVSNKMSTWNDTNKFPHNNFIWVGLDGTEVNACVPPVHFNSWMDPNQAIRNWEAFRDKDYCEESLQMFGYGDGGSGVTDEMIQYYYRQQNMGGIPEMRLTTGKDYLHSVFHDTENYPRWDGDLYLEMHRGTFTSKGVLKSHNRKGEFQAQRTETTVAFSSLLTGKLTVAEKALQETWKKLLFNQFHDILPGSHTAPVTVDALRMYHEMEKEFSHFENEALAAITSKENDTFTAVNTSSDTAHVAYFDSMIRTQAITDGSRVFPVQKQVKPDGTCVSCTLLEQPGLSVQTYTPCESASASSDMFVSVQKMENQFCCLKFDEHGNLIDMLDKVHHQQVNKSGQILNQWHLYQDCPGMYNAWDIVTTYRDHDQLLDGWGNITVAENGPVSVALRMEKHFGNSSAVQIVRLYSNSPRVDFDTFVDWHESEKLLKAIFPLNVKARHYTTDTSAGVMERINNKNTTWEQARFEVPFHKWVDLSEGMFGVAVLSDCKYGCNVEDSTIGLSLLKAPIRPDRESDRGQHRFTYSLYPHGACWQTDGLVESAYELNNPLLIHCGLKLNQAGMQMFSLDNPAVKIQALKLAEDGSSDIILRLVEVYGSHGNVHITSNKKIVKAFLCDLMETVSEEYTVKENSISVPFAPNKIISIRLQF